MDRKDVINKVFPHSLFGYDPIAVDAFLDEVIREFDRLNNSIDVLQFRLAHELGDAYHQNDVLSRELEFAMFGRRAGELPAPGAEGLLPEPTYRGREERQEETAPQKSEARPAAEAGAQAREAQVNEPEQAAQYNEPAKASRPADPDEVTTEDRSFYPDDEVTTEDRTPYPDDDVTTEDRSFYPENQ